MDRNLAVAISKCRIIDVSGTFQRHASLSVRTLTGSDAGGRWGAPGAYSVLYLGRPTDSVIAEAYRHLVDDIEGEAVERRAGAQRGRHRRRRPLVCEAQSGGERRRWPSS